MAHDPLTIPMFPSVTASPNFRTWIKVPKACSGVRNYNGSTCRVGTSLIHCWRSEDAVGKSTLWLGQVDAKGKLSKCRELIADPAFDAEDPRLFTVGSSLRLMWSKVRDTRHACGSWQVVQMLSHLDPATLAIISSAEIELPGIKSRFVEKNWTPLLIAEGHRYGNFKPGFSTIAAFHEVLRAHGLTPPPPTPAAPVKGYEAL